MRNLQFSVLTLLGLAIASPMAHAGSIVLYNTGVGVSSTLLGTGASDPHYTLTTNPASGGTSTAYVATTPNPAWHANTSTSQWINPVVTGGSQPPVVVNGEYDYVTTFSLTGYDPTTARITGQLTADDTVSDILINGHSTSQSTPSSSYANFYAFSIGSTSSAYFLQGVNTITFKVQNTGNGPSALQVQISGTALPAPEPAAILPIVIGTLGLLTLGLKARKVQPSA